MANDIERVDRGPVRPPWLLSFRSSNGFILATVCVAIFTDAFLYGVVVPVLPFSLQERSGVPEDEVQWWTSFIFAVFGAAIIVGSLICGWIADRTSNRSSTYFVGLFILAAATLLFGLAKAAWILVISRLIQGLSAAIVYTVGLVLLADTVGQKNIGSWMGTALSSSSFGVIISPLLGGVVYNRAGYTAVFAMAMSLIVVDIGMRIFMIEKRTAAKYLTKEPTITDTRNFTTFTNSNTNGHTSESISPRIDANEDSSSSISNSYAETDALLGGQENGTPRSKRNPKVNGGSTQPPAVVSLLKSPRVLAAIYGIFVNVSILAAFDVVLPLFVKVNFHWNSFAAGLMFLSIAIPALAGPLVGILSDRFGPRWIAITGFSLTAVPLILMRLIDDDSIEKKVLLCGLLCLCGCTLILIVAPVASDLSAVVEDMEKEHPDIFGPGGAYGQAFALFNCSMAAATIFGPVFADVPQPRIANVVDAFSSVVACEEAIFSSCITFYEVNKRGFLSQSKLHTEAESLHNDRAFKEIFTVVVIRVKQLFSRTVSHGGKPLGPDIVGRRLEWQQVEVPIRGGIDWNILCQNHAVSTYIAFSKLSGYRSDDSAIAIFQNLQARLGDTQASQSELHSYKAEQLRTSTYNTALHIFYREQLDTSLGYRFEITIQRPRAKMAIASSDTIDLSGSTGNPNGIVQEHGSSHALQYAAYTFDVGMMDIFLRKRAYVALMNESCEDRRSNIMGIMNTMQVLGGEAVKQENFSRWAYTVRLYSCYGTVKCAVSTINLIKSQNSKAGTIGRAFSSGLC
ncbi:hypothetical protein B7494_g6472 [Chlorociboria aeruginascens]|nr:hypothetical protein B7494_g6472 [Chlorociboria aeruginascens]